MLAILIFLKAPKLGFVKTRLAKEIGDERALATFKLLAERQVAALPTYVRTELHFTPTNAAKTMEQWLPQIPNHYAQSGDDLGERLKNATAAAFSRGASTVICIGGDCPSLSVSHFNQTDALLKGGADLVFGPSEDGGYYLVGLKPHTLGIFDEIPWSAPDTLQRSLERAETLDLRTKVLETLYDVDEVQELERAITDRFIEA